MEGKPHLIVIFGLPGTGKSTLARALAGHLGATYFNSDIIREELGKRGQYRQEDKEAVYQALFEGMEKALNNKENIIVDATFSKEELRHKVVKLAARHQAPIKWIETRAAPETVAERVGRKRPYSEADYGVYRKISQEFDPFLGESLRVPTDEMDLQEQLKTVLNYVIG